MRQRSHLHSEHDESRIPPSHWEEEKGIRFWRYLARYYPAAKDFNLSLKDAFSKAEREIPSVASTRGIKGGSPCIKGTRIPVYMVLDAIEYYGDLEGVRRSYPHLTIEQIRDAVRFSKVVMDCYLEH